MQIDTLPILYTIEKIYCGSVVNLYMDTKYGYLSLEERFTTNREIPKFPLDQFGKHSDYIGISTHDQTKIEYYISLLRQSPFQIEQFDQWIINTNEKLRAENQYRRN